MNFDTDRFLTEIQNRVAIWDSRSTAYSNKVMKGKAWEEICDIFIPNFRDINPAEKNKAAIEMQRKWKSYRDSFRRELAIKKKTKSGSGAQTGRKEYIYFQQLLFLLPVCETKPQEEEIVEDRSQENLDDESTSTTCTPRSRSVAPKRKRNTSSSEEQRLFQTLAQNIEKKSFENKTDEDPDRHFLLSLLPHFKTFSEDIKLDVQMEFIKTIKQYKAISATTYINTPVISHFSPNNQTVRTVNQYSHTQSVPISSRHDSQHSRQQFVHNNPAIYTELQPLVLHSSTPDLDEPPTSLSSASSVCEDYF